MSKEKVENDIKCPSYILIGIGLIGDSLYLPISYRSWLYILASVIFIVYEFLKFPL